MLALYYNLVREKNIYDQKCETESSLRFSVIDLLKNYRLSGGGLVSTIATITLSMKNSVIVKLFTV